MRFPSKKVKLIIVTYRDAYQWALRQKEGSEANYQDQSNLVNMSPTDLEALAISEGAKVKLSGPKDSIVVKVKAHPGCPSGYGFIPVSSYINKLADYDPRKAQLPNFKRIEVMAEVVEA
jgi:formylmethanofuran dehydrogenase subunit D